MGFVVGVCKGMFVVCWMHVKVLGAAQYSVFEFHRLYQNKRGGEPPKFRQQLPQSLLSAG